jgi:hypothetical protein
MTIVLGHGHRCWTCKSIVSTRVRLRRNIAGIICAA